MRPCSQSSFASSIRLPVLAYTSLSLSRSALSAPSASDIAPFTALSMSLRLPSMAFAALFTSARSPFRAFTCSGSAGSMSTPSKNSSTCATKRSTPSRLPTVTFGRV